MGMAAVFAMRPRPHCHFTLSYEMDALYQILVHLSVWLLDAYLLNSLNDG